MSKAWDWVMMPLGRWDAPYSSTAFSLARELAKSQRVFYLDNPYTGRDFIQRWTSHEAKTRRAYHLGLKRGFQPIPRLPESLQVLYPPLVWPINWMPASKPYQWALAHNRARVSRALLRALRQQQVKRFVWLNVFNPFYELDFPDELRPALRLYYSVDNMAASAYVQKHGPALENQVMQQADLVLATSQTLAQEVIRKTRTPVKLLPNAADVPFFQSAMQQVLALPSSLAKVKGPIVLYLGAIGRRLDYPLLEAVICRHPDKQFVFIGPRGNGYDPRLESLPQVHFTGPLMPVEFVPYLQHAACALIPFRLNALTESIYPLKVHEYLAAGLPVVSTPFSPDIRSLPGLRLAREADAFAKQVQEAIEQDSLALRQSRSERAQAHSWAGRAAQLKAWAEAALDQPFSPQK